MKKEMKDKLKNDHAGDEQIPRGISTAKEADLQDENQELKVAIAEQGKQIQQLMLAVDPNRLAAVQRRNAEMKGSFFVGIPSLDGEHPIVSWIGKGGVFIDRYGNEVDEQKVIYKTSNGEEGSMEYKTFMSIMMSHIITARTNNLKALKNRDGYRIHEEKEREDLISVTLSTDNGVTYEGETLDIPYGFFQSGGVDRDSQK